MGKRPFVRLAAVAAGGVLALVVASPALAADTTVPLTGDHKGTTAAQFPQQECDRIFATKADDEDGWHFVLTQFGSARKSDVGLSLSFTNGDGNPVAIKLDNLDSFTHLLVPTEGSPLRKNVVWQLWLVTPAGWTLVDGSVTAPSGTFGVNPQFNLSHACPGEPPASVEPTPPAGEEPTPPASEAPTPPASEEPTPPVSEVPTPPAVEESTPPAGEKPKEPGLPVTGTSLGGLLILSGGLLSAGIALVAVRRRRSLSDLLDG